MDETLLEPLGPGEKRQAAGNDRRFRAMSLVGFLQKRRSVQWKPPVGGNSFARESPVSPQEALVKGKNLGNVSKLGKLKDILCPVCVVEGCPFSNGTQVFLPNWEINFLGIDSPFFSTIVLFKNPPVSPGFRRFSRFGCLERMELEGIPSARTRLSPGTPLGLRRGRVAEAWHVRSDGVEASRKKFNGLGFRADYQGEWAWLKKSRGVTQGLIHGSTYQGSILVPVF